MTILGPDGNPMQFAQKGGESGGTIIGYLGSTLTGSEAKDLSEAELNWHFAQTHPWVGAGVTLIANTIRAAGYDIVAPGPDLTQVAVDTKDPVAESLRTYLAQVNPEKAIEDLMHEVSQDYDVVGRAYLNVIRDSFGRNVGLQRIDARTMAPILSDDGKKIASFRQRIRVNGVPKTINYKPEDIYFFRRPGPDPLLGGKSLLENLDLTIAVDYGSRRHNAAYFRNGARAGTYIIYKTGTKEFLEHNKKVIEETRSGPDNAYRPMLLAGDIAVTVPAAGENDEEFGSAQDRAREEVCAVYHIPESKLKTVSGTLGGNGKENDDQTFHEECIMPRAIYLWSWLTFNLRKDFPAIANLSIVPKSKYQIRVSAIEDAVLALQAGATINEARDLVGWTKLPPKSQEADLDTPYVASTVAQAQDKPDPIALAKTKAQNMPTPGGPAAKKALELIRERRACRRQASQVSTAALSA